ncbi:MAG: Hsp20/alpha crystallin family protein [Syntrophomonadaceae bacterium]|nr:Hsp20/alpha crystallin family protein [Syntrophomonadaceae bacterium]MDH7497263.1 Hsp20/alpha crystallin family protein [Syntrophomonadaceae bacterium]
MSMMRWEPWRPFRELLDLQSSLSQMMSETLGGKFPSWGQPFPADITEDEKNYYVKAELPGMSPENIKISYSGGRLTIQGEKSQETKKEGATWVWMERSYGSFSRTFTLPTAVKEDAIKATYKQGVLEVTLPKVEETKPAEIPIQVQE